MQLERPIGQEEFRREVFATNSYLSLTRSLIDPTFAAFIQSFCNNHPPLQVIPHTIVRLATGIDDKMACRTCLPSSLSRFESAGSNY